MTLEVRGLCTSIGKPPRALLVLDRVDLTVERGEVLGLIGESGSGKTMLGLSILRLTPPQATITAERLRFLGHNLLDLTEAKLRGLRGGKMAMVFQDPVGAFNPAKTVGWHLRLALSRVRSEAADRSAEPGRDTLARLLTEVGISNGPYVMRQYPHQLSGGMLQRILIAMVLTCSPDLIVADEPTTNLDAMVEQQIIELFRALLRRLSVALIYITHDIAVAAALCDRIAVMYAGQIVEEGPARAIFAAPRHPYTQGLLATALALDAPSQRLSEISGDLPSLADLPSGCRFEPRCPFAMPVCTQAVPAMTPVGEGHAARCVLCQ